MREPMVIAEPPPQGDAGASRGPRAGVAVTLDGVASSLGSESARRDMACGFGGRATDPADENLALPSSFVLESYTCTVPSTWDRCMKH